MEALGPGKEPEAKQQARASRVRGACARTRRLTRGRGCGEASTRAPAAALSDSLLLWRLLRTSRPTACALSPCVRAAPASLWATRDVPRGCFYPKPAPLVVSRTALCEWGFNSVPSFLPSSRPSASWCVYVGVCGRRARTPNPKTTQTRRHLLIDRSPSNKPSNSNHRHRAERVSRRLGPR